MILYVEGKPNQKAIDLVKAGELILINTDDIKSSLEIESAYSKAKRAMVQGSNISRDLGSETMLYLYGGRQISEAIKKYGIKETQEKYFLITESALDVKSLNLEIKEFKENAEIEEIFTRLEKIAMLEIKK